MRHGLSLLVCASLIGSAAAAQTYIVRSGGLRDPDAPHDVTVRKSALAGQEVRVWWAMLLNADCTAAGTMTTQIVQPPRHGDLRLSDDPFYPSFPVTNPRSGCDSKPAPGKQAFYTSANGFHGHDRMVIRNATSEGRMRRITIDVAVQ